MLQTSKIKRKQKSKRNKQKKKIKKRNGRILSLEWNIVYWLLKSPCFEFFQGWKIRSFLSEQIDGNMMFTDYWKVLVLNLLGMGNRIFFWVKKLMERWYLLNTEKFLFLSIEKFLFWTFRECELRTFLA